MSKIIDDYKKRMNYDMWEDIQTVEVPCKEHPDAPHGFDRTSSHSLGRYVCECEGWSEDDQMDITTISSILPYDDICWSNG